MDSSLIELGKTHAKYLYLINKLRPIYKFDTGCIFDELTGTAEHIGCDFMEVVYKEFIDLDKNKEYLNISKDYKDSINQQPMFLSTKKILSRDADGNPIYL